MCTKVYIFVIIVIFLLKFIKCENCTPHMTTGNRVKCLNSLSEIVKDFVSDIIPDGLISIDINDTDASSLDYAQLSNSDKLKLGELGFDLLSDFNVLNVPNLQQTDINTRNSYIDSLIYSMNTFKDLKQTVNPTIFIDKTQIENLFLENNSIKQIDFIVKIPSLKHLNLRMNLINELPANVFMFSPLLETLNLAENTIQAIRPDSLNGLNNMKFFNISGNRLMSIESTAFNGFKQSKVSEIDLSNNLIASIVSGAFDPLRYVTLLKLDNNRLTKLSSAVFNGLRSLNKISLSKNQLVEIAPTTFYNSPLLHTIDFSENFLRSFSNNIFGQDDKIKRLLINNNQIETIAPNTFSTMYNLNFLRLDNNMLVKLDDYMFASCSLLHTLYLNNNLIEEIPINTFGIGQRLKFLYMDYNRISFLPVFSTQLPSLIKLTIEGNPWECSCLQDILTWIKDNVQDYIFDDYRGQKPVCVVILDKRNICHRNLAIIKKNRIVDIFHAARLS